MSTITLDEVIKQGEELKSNLRPERYMGSIGYEWESDKSQSLYTSWKNTCKRFLAVNFPNDISRNDFEGAIRAFEQDKSPQNFQEIIGVLQGYKSIPSVLKVNTSSSNKNSNKNLCQCSCKQ